MAKFYVVWNNSKTEGFITNSPDDAEVAASGFISGVSCSSLANAFREVYADEDMDEDDCDQEFSIEEVDIPITTLD